MAAWVAVDGGCGSFAGDFAVGVVGEDAGDAEVVGSEEERGGCEEGFGAGL